MVREYRVPGGTSTLDQAPNGNNGYFSDPNCDICPTGAQAMADNFIINSGGGFFQINQIVTWGGYFPGNVPNAVDDFDILIHNNAGGLPGATILFSVSGIQATTRAMTGIVLFGVDEWIFTFDLAAPPTLPNGTYWIEIINNTVTTPGNDYFWETGNFDPVNGGGPGGAFSQQAPGVSWNPNPDDQAAMIIGTPVPVELQGFSVE